LGGIYYFRSYKKFKNILLFVDYIKFDLIFLFAIFFVFNFFLIEFDFYIIFSSRSFLLLFIFLSIIFFIENFLSIKLISIHFNSQTFFLLDWIFLRANWWSFVSDLLMNDKIQIKWTRVKSKRNLRCNFKSGMKNLLRSFYFSILLSHWYFVNPFSFGNSIFI